MPFWGESAWRLLEGLAAAVGVAWFFPQQHVGPASGTSKHGPCVERSAQPPLACRGRFQQAGRQQQGERPPRRVAHNPRGVA